MNQDEAMRPKKKTKGKSTARSGSREWPSERRKDSGHVGREWGCDFECLLLAWPLDDEGPVSDC